MLAKNYRLPSSVIFKHPRTYHEDLFLLKFQANGLSYARFGFVVSKSIDNKAVVRNRAKRTFRSILEKEWQNAFPGIDMLFVLRPMVKELTFMQMSERVRMVLEKITI